MRVYIDNKEIDYVRDFEKFDEWDEYYKYINFFTYECYFWTRLSDENIAICSYEVSLKKETIKISLIGPTDLLCTDMKTLYEKTVSVPGYKIKEWFGFINIAEKYSPVVEDCHGEGCDGTAWGLTFTYSDGTIKKVAGSFTEPIIFSYIKSQLKSYLNFVEPIYNKGL